MYIKYSVNVSVVGMCLLEKPKTFIYIFRFLFKCFFSLFAFFCLIIIIRFKEIERKKNCQTVRFIRCCCALMVFYCNLIKNFLIWKNQSKQIKKMIMIFAMKTLWFLLISPFIIITLWEKKKVLCDLRFVWKKNVNHHHD